MIITAVGQILFLCSLTIAGLLVNRSLKLELTLSCAIVGLLAGLSLGYINVDTGIRAHNFQDVVFFVILPVLIFEAAWHLKLRLLKRWIIPILVLATVGVLISCVVTAGLMYLCWAFSRVYLDSCFTNRCHSSSNRSSSCYFSASC